LLFVVGCASTPTAPAPQSGAQVPHIQAPPSFITMERTPKTNDMAVRRKALTVRVVDTSVTVAVPKGYKMTEDGDAQGVLPDREDFEKVARVLLTLRAAHPGVEFSLAACTPDGKRGYLTPAVRWVDAGDAEGSAPRFEGGVMPDGRRCNLLFIAHSHPIADYETRLSTPDLQCAHWPWQAKVSIVFNTETDVYGLDCNAPDAAKTGPVLSLAIMGRKTDPVWLERGTCKAPPGAVGVYPGCLEK
jgi:hypothetical protein